MPHRTTYFFPRQFPERGFDASSKVFKDHEKKIEVGRFDGERDVKESKISKEVAVGGKSGTVWDRITGDKIHGKQLAAFVNWLAERKREKSGDVKVRLDICDEEGHEHELLLRPESPEAVVARKDRGFEREGPLETLSSGTGHGDPPGAVVAAAKERGFDWQAPLQPSEFAGGGRVRGFDRQTSLPRFSSGSCSAGSLFSGTTLDENLSSDVNESQFSTTMEVEEEEEPFRKKEEDEEKEESRKSLARKSRDRYFLQIALAKRLAEQASLASEPFFPQDRGVESLAVCSDAEAASHRLWVQSLTLSLICTRTH